MIETTVAKLCEYIQDRENIIDNVEKDCDIADWEKNILSHIELSEPTGFCCLNFYFVFN